MPIYDALLVSMPWASTAHPSLGLGTLVASAKHAGFSCRAIYANLLFSTYINADIYEYFANTPSFFAYAEHIFAVDIFGRDRLNSDDYLLELAGKSDQSSAAIKSLLHLRDTVVPTFMTQCTEHLLASNAFVVGFSCTFNQVMPSIAIARRIKQVCPETIIIFGGACVHDKMGESYARGFTQFIDHVFTGEADNTFPAFLRAIRDGSDITCIPGVTVNGKLKEKAQLVRELDLLPTPDYNDYFTEYSELESQGHLLAQCTDIPFEASRGCWWGEKSHCTFCGLNNQGLSYRSKTSTKVLSELQYLAVKHQTTRFMAADNILEYRGYKDLLPKIAKLPGQFQLFFEIKSNLRRDDVAMLAEAGVGWVQPGIESFSNHVLSVMRKGVSVLQNVQMLKWAKEYGIIASYNLLVGFAGERNEDYNEIIQTIETIFHLKPPSRDADIVQVHRFSPFFDQPVELGIINLRPAAYYARLIPTDIIDAADFAYFFDHDIPVDSPAIRNLSRLNEVIGRWRKSDIKISARLGMGFIEIETSCAGTTKIVILDLLSSLIFLLADHQTSMSSIVDRILRLQQGSTQNEIVAATENLISNGYIIVVGNHILSIVPFDRPQKQSDIDCWITHWIS